MHRGSVLPRGYRNEDRCRCLASSPHSWAHGMAIVLRSRCQLGHPHRVLPASSSASRLLVSDANPSPPKGLLALDPQLICYSWITGIAEVAQVVFVRKRLVEVQYLRTTISEEQREEFGYLTVDTIRRIESADFPAHSGIRFPQNPCSACPYLGLCLGKAGVGRCRPNAAARS